jgi:hypothetical protein
MEVRLRFIAVLVAVGLLIGYWDAIKNYWDKWTRPQAVAARQLEPGQEFFCPMHPKWSAPATSPTATCPSVRSAACRFRYASKASRRRCRWG